MGQSFVFIFRQGIRKLSEEENKQRTEEVRGWALEQLKKNRNFEPRVLGDEGQRLGNEPAHANDGNVIALNFIEATNFEEALQIAKSHPGLRYGVQIEVRPWKDPRAVQAVAN